LQHQHFMRPCKRPPHCGICICSCCFYIITQHYLSSWMRKAHVATVLVGRMIWWVSKLWVFTKCGVGVKDHRYSHPHYCRAQLVNVEVVKTLYNFFSPFLVFNVSRYARIMCELHLVACTWGWVPLAMLHKMVGQLLVLRTEVFCVMTWSK